MGNLLTTTTTTPLETPTGDDVALHALLVDCKNALGLDSSDIFARELRRSVHVERDTSNYITSLYLEINGLFDDMPRHIIELTHLQSLNLRYQTLTQLTPEISKLVHLRCLNVTGNQLTSVPPEIGTLNALEELYLNHNPLSDLPSELSHLTNLRVLDLGRMRLTRVPKVVFKLSSLQSLYLTGNQLNILPSPLFFNLSSLTYLCIAHNEITDIPPTIKHLSRLQTLNASNNRLACLPQEIDSLRELHRIDLDDNDLTVISPSILALPNLLLLDVMRNCLLVPCIEIPFLYCRQYAQRIPTRMQLGEFFDDKSNELSFFNDDYDEFVFTCRGNDDSDNGDQNTATRTIYVDAQRLASRWTYLQRLLEAGMEEARTKTADVSSYFSARSILTIVQLFDGREANLADLSIQDCRDLLEHAEQFQLDESLRLLMIYCKTRIKENV